MAKVRRQIITIDAERCDGCGNCVPSCAEGALQVIGGKARLMKQSYCDGLGACLGECPQGALSVVEMDVDAYDEVGVVASLREKSPELVEKHIAHLAAHGMASTEPGGQRAFAPTQGSPSTPLHLHSPASVRQSAPVSFAACPSVQMRVGSEHPSTPAPTPVAGRQRSELRQWPVQLHLVPIQAPFFNQATLTLVADCVPFAYPNFHADFLADSAIAVGCPKLDDGRAYIAKLTEILRNNDIRSLKVLRMEVPCCGGLIYVAEQALAASGKAIPLERVVIPIQE